MKTFVQSVAVLIDGGFFLKRYAKLVDPAGDHTPAQVANYLFKLALRHVGKNHLYRMFYYDCHPFDKKRVILLVKE